MTGFYQVMSEEMLKNVYPFLVVRGRNDEWIRWSSRPGRTESFARKQERAGHRARSATC